MPLDAQRSPISITLNGRPNTAYADEPLSIALQRWNESDDFAVAHNDQFVPRGEYTEIILSEGDRIEILTPMQGG